MNERGVVLLEILIAMAILSMVGVSTISFLGATLEAEMRLQDRERELVAAENALIATALLSRAELDLRIGVREVGRFAVWVDRPQPTLFRVGIAPRERPTAELLSTLVYRPGRPR